MTTTTEMKEVTRGLTDRSRPLGNRIYRVLQAIPTWVLWLLVILWSIPSFGLFVNSFRTRDSQRASGWWNAFTDACQRCDFDDELAGACTNVCS